jgi:PAS domain S-box-containing protein
MTQDPKPIRIAVIVDRVESPGPAPLILPFTLEGYPPVQIKLFNAGSGPPAPAGKLNSLPELKAEQFDLILDWQHLAPQLGQVDQLISGPGAEIVEQLVCLLEGLRQKQEINTGIINSATDAIVTINEDHVIVGYNRGAEQVLGYTREEALGQDLSLIIPPPYKEEHRDYVRRFVATRQPHVIGKHLRLTALRRDGSEFPMSISFSVAEIMGNLYFTGIIRDITEYQEMEDRLLVSEKLAAIGNTVSQIAHEIKNPLLIIGGFARQLQKVTQLDDKAHKKLAIIAEEVARLEKILAEMRDFVRPPQAHKSHGRIEDVLDESLEFFQEMFNEHHIEVRRVKEGPLPASHFDPQQMRQVLLNLFKNALEAMPRGGVLTLTTRVKDSELEISVTDTGEGMAPEVAANVFQPYYTTKEKGTGLGLAICQFIVEKQHGGCLEVESTPGQGSTFTVRLPLEAPPA